MNNENSKRALHRLSRRDFLRGSALATSAALAALVTGARGAMPDPQAAPKRIYLAPDDHTDYYWTADGATYQQAFLDMLDYYLDQCDSTAGEPPEHQSRWNCDGSRLPHPWCAICKSVGRAVFSCRTRAN